MRRLASFGAWARVRVRVVALAAVYAAGGCAAAAGAAALGMATLDVAFAPPLQAQRIETTSHAEHPTVGDPIVVELRVVLPAGAVTLDSSPRLHAPLSDGVRVLDPGAWRASRGALTARVVLAFFRAGSTSTPSFDLAYRRSPGTTADTARGVALAMVIVPTLPENAASMRDIKDVMPLPGAERSRWIALAIGVVALVVLVFLAARSRGRAAEHGNGAFVTEPAVDSGAVALQELDAIERAGWATSDVARYYEQVSATLRRYLERAHALRALDRTTPEIIGLLPEILAGDNMQAQLAELLEDADLVKFARWRPHAPEAAAYLARARALLGAWRDRAKLDVAEERDAVR
ncbi:MAG TPA: hypothetical protein VN677_07675 [Gemmatimonadaceae bacterium]|jgi:hypothetical protein|nr:hypothetical protein [Gemmatimonadaceae bacterium]